MKERRINLRVEGAEWKAWDDKRHEEGGEWQSMGLSLFRQWFEGERSVAVHPNEDSEETGKGILTEEVRIALEDVAVALHNILKQDNAARTARHQVHADAGGDTQVALDSNRSDRAGTSQEKTG